MNDKTTLFENAQFYEKSLDDLMLRYNLFLNNLNNIEPTENILIVNAHKDELLRSAKKIAQKIGSKASTREELHGMFAEMGVDPKLGFNI
jgi:hypothetical protein